MHDITRRDLMKQGGLIALGLVAPSWLSRLAHADAIRQATGGGDLGSKVLVVCQLTGGNDGLNTVVPYADTLYRQLRPSLALPEAQVLKVSDHLGFHPAMEGFATLFHEGKVAIVQNVGYPDPNRSHFKSMEIWQSASPDGRLSHGWVGRHFDAQMASTSLNPVVALGLSTERPLALTAQQASIPCFASLADIEQLVGDEDAERRLRRIQGQDARQGSLTRAVQDANRAALDSMAELQRRLRQYEPGQGYGSDPFGRGFRQVAHLIGASSATRLVYFSAGGFDTHARQADQHARLLAGFSEGLLAFQREIEAMGRADDVIVMVFSEFGRRVAENASLGTDHGAAAPMFLIGTSVRGGFHGQNPNLRNLHRGDLKHETDFRQVYATALERWMGGDPVRVLGQEFPTLDVLRT